MPESGDIHWQPLERLLATRPATTSGLAGFDAEFSDIVDFILKITHRIWEQKDIGLCYRYYADGCPVHTLSSYSDSVEDVVRGTLKTLAAFPDRILIGENVIWSPNGAGGFYSSHRITSTMTNSGPSEFGPATGRTGRVTTIADCVCENNRIVYEWLVRDNSFLVKQLGLDPIDLAADLAAIAPGPKFISWWQREFARVSGLSHDSRAPPEPATREPEALARWWLHALFNEKLFGVISELYARNARVEWPGGRHVVGLRGISGAIIQWLAQVPDAKASCDHLAVTRFDGRTVDVALRWSLAGHFDSREPRLLDFRGRPTLVLAASHLRIVDGRIAEEWTVFDEVAMLANLRRLSDVAA